MAAKKKAKTPGKKADGKSKTAKVIALLQRPNGVTREQVLSMIDWQAISFSRWPRLPVSSSSSKRLRASRPFIERCNNA